MHISSYELTACFSDAVFATGASSGRRFSQRPQGKGQKSKRAQIQWLLTAHAAPPKSKARFRAGSAPAPGHGAMQPPLAFELARCPSWCFGWQYTQSSVLSNMETASTHQYVSYLNALLS
jgi:hypothetical protein